MNTNFTIDDLADWIENIKLFAEGDHELSIAWFKGTKDSPFSIIAGWQNHFSGDPDFSDCFCLSASNPEYVMCIKIAKNEGPYAYTDYDIMNMPYDKDTGDVDDVEIMLEWEDDPEDLAEFFIQEWERIMKEYN